MPKLVLSNLEDVALLIKLNNRYATFVKVYQSPMYMSDYEQIMSVNDSIILAAGRWLNTKHTNWTCRVINPNGIKL